MSELTDLPKPALEALAGALEQGRLQPPYGVMAISRYVEDDQAAAICGIFNQWHQAGVPPLFLARTLRIQQQERSRTQEALDRTQLVWSGPEYSGSGSRDSGMVVRELFARARHHLLLSSYAIDDGVKARDLFQPLAQNMDANPDLQVQFFLNVKRAWGEKKPDQELVQDFARDFREKVWQGRRLPELYHDPRALAPHVRGPDRKRACLHAKCLVMDGTEVLLTSANYTQAAQDRNIEAGFLVRDPVLARQVLHQFDSLLKRGFLRPVA